MILLDYARVLLRRWWLVVLPVIVAGTVIALSYQPPVTTFQVKMRFAVGLPPEQVAGVYNYDRHYDWLASEYFTRGIQDILQTSKFAENILTRLVASSVVPPATIAPGQIQGALRSDYRASIIDIYVTWPDAEMARQIAQAVVDELNENDKAYWPQLTNAPAPVARVLDVPIAVPIAIDLRGRFDVPVRLGLGLGVGLLLAFLAHAFDRTVRDKREIEQMGLNVMGEIP